MSKKEHELLDEALVAFESLRGMLTKDFYINKIKPVEERIRFFLVDERIKEFKLNQMAYIKRKQKEQEAADTVPQQLYNETNFGKFD